MNELVQRLATGKHPVMVGGPQPSLKDLKRRVEAIGFVFIKFTETRGGTTLGVRIGKLTTDLSLANFDQKNGIVHIEGTLTLNYEPVRCIADIDLTTLQGTGCLVT